MIPRDAPLAEAAETMTTRCEPARNFEEAGQGRAGRSRQAMRHNDAEQVETARQLQRGGSCRPAIGQWGEACSIRPSCAWSGPATSDHPPKPSVQCRAPFIARDCLKHSPSAANISRTAQSKPQHQMLARLGLGWQSLPSPALLALVGHACP
ncbi:uncharacterized protein B0I36DRAFT_311424 [Microdochium trichocladiopsis]|uniref:Uncharacterized protein n=1 Tax=Microdochium trichocladiopsis TaxID=1682393 RepID=A0A9P9BWG3_9PEZI|nr:uncharacterized protein B0I36DRAFT_311424 [Microdochium trichocladiopsis]KAH7040767.1 hypothetical protein B0I36DRAFT_311424 [Microdochium trichocladiopsis]